MHRIYFLIIYSVIAIMPSTTLHAEILSVQMRWTPGLCKASCHAQLEREFQKNPAIASIAINGAGGTAEFMWKPGAAFSYTDIKRTMQSIGLFINEIRVKVSGTIKSTKERISLVSTGDRTVFDLINPVIANSTGQATVYNLAARQLQPELRQKLLDAEQNKQLVIIEGSLFMPHRSPPLVLVVENLQFSESSKVNMN